MIRAKVLTIGAGLLLTAGTAFADGDDASGGGAATGGEGAGSGSATAPAAPEVGGGAAMGGDQLISTSLTPAKSGLGVFGELEILRVSIPAIPPLTDSQSFTAEALAIGAGYGVNDKLEIGGSYALPLHDDSGVFPNSGEGPLDIFGAYSLMAGKLSVAASADFTIDVGNTDNKGINAGVAVRYAVAPNIAVFSGNPLPYGPAGQQLSISLADMGPITFNIPAGVAFQATPKAFLWADTEIADLSISNSSNAFIFSDFIPLEVAALFRATPEIDVGVNFRDDLKNAGDAYIFGVMARYYKH